MTLMGVVNTGPKKVFFADKRWLDNPNPHQTKFFWNAQGFAIACGYMLTPFMAQFPGISMDEVPDLIADTYGKHNIPASAIITQDMERDRTQIFIANKGIEVYELGRYFVAGINSPDLSDLLDGADYDRELLSILKLHAKNNPLYVSSTFDVVVACDGYYAFIELS